MKDKLQKCIDFAKKYYFIIFAIMSLALPDIVLGTRIDPALFSENYVNIVSWFFTAAWVFLILYISICLLPEKVGRICYIVVAGFFIIYSLCQYVYFKIFDQFFWVKSVILADQGTGYLGYAIQQLDAVIITGVIVSVVSVIISAIKWRSVNIRPKKVGVIFVIVPVLLITGLHIGMSPEVHGDTPQWDSWRKPRMAYSLFNDTNKSFDTTGLYQFVFRDIYKTVFPEQYDKKELEKAEEYFAAKGSIAENEYSGIFEGKNVIAVMLESIDTWMIDEKHMPTVSKMMQSGINFTNYNAPFFGVGFTFNSEFAFNTGFYTPVSAVSAANFSSNSYPYALPRLFRDKGYTVNSFHFNTPDFYNRGLMHQSFGYEKYHSFKDFGLSDLDAQLDSNAMKIDEIYAKMTEKQPFFNFVVTYSAHLPYNSEDAKMAEAKKLYPELVDADMTEEKNNALILAADTDEFFRLLLEKLEADGLLDDTVIVAYTDHFAYGVSEDVLFEECKQEELKYRVPAFIYAKGMESTEISKPMMTADWPATLANLFNLDRSGGYIGADVLNPDNGGFVYFETFAWMDERMHYVPNDEENMNQEDRAHIEAQSNRVRECREINDIVVLGDYFGR